MSDLREMLQESAARLFAAHAEAAAEAEARGWQGALWDEVEALGVPMLLVPESAGGIGGDWDDACAVLQASGRWQLPLPLAETVLARRLLALAGLAVPDGPLSVTPYCQGVLAASAGGWQFTGQLKGVPWGRDVARIATVVTCAGTPHLVVLARAAAVLQQAVNLAGEPRDSLRFSAAAVEAAPIAAPEAASLLDHAALARTAQIAGALQAALERTVAYAGERKQFGRAIGQFQAVQQQLALMGEETAAVDCAVRAAARAAGSGDAAFQIAAAKLRANLAIGTATATAHQVHAAIGFTWEYALRHATQRLWAWRSEFGNDRYWSGRLGQAVVARGADSFWADLTARDDAAAIAGG